jgi:hypothetical protein
MLFIRGIVPGGHGMDGTLKWNTPLEQRLQHANSGLSSRRRRLLESILENAEELQRLREIDREEAPVGRWYKRDLAAEKKRP